MNKIVDEYNTHIRLKSLRNEIKSVEDYISKGEGKDICQMEDKLVVLKEKERSLSRRVLNDN